MQMEFDSRDIRYKSPFGAVSSGERVELLVGVACNSRLGKPEIVVHFEEDGRCYSYEGHREREENGFFYYSFSILTEGYTGLVWYHFYAKREDGTECWCGPRMGHTGGRGVDYRYNVANFQLTVYEKGFETPRWLSKGVVYHVFVDRFNRGNDTPLKPSPDYDIHLSPDELPVYAPDGEGIVRNRDIYGGDLKGVIKKLPYIKSLGAVAIYLSPIFEAWSNHKYNTADYMKIDEMFGTMDDFEELCREAKALNIKIILDGVFSHTGSDSVYFNKEGRYGKGGAFRDPGSPYKSWYRFIDYPNRYESWWGIDTLPAVDETEPSYLEFITGDRGVINKWTGLGGSGWRLDVADELPEPFIERLRSALKAQGGDPILIGEVWEDATNKISYGKRRTYLLGRGLDGVLNYPLKEAVIAFLRGEAGGPEFSRRMMDIYENYPAPAQCCLFNLLGSHDTERILTALSLPLQKRGMDKEGMARYAHSADELSTGERLLRLAALIVWSLPGAPCLYYGDEAGMTGFGDPFCRRFYPWGRENVGLIDYFKELGKIKGSLPPLWWGDVRIEPVGDDAVMIIRSLDKARAAAVVNRACHSVEIPLPFSGGWVDLIGGERGRGARYSVPGQSAALLVGE